jgi:membrane protease YdiL (CAAX protease family)
MLLVFLATYFAGLVMAATDLGRATRTDLAYLVPILALSGTFGIVAIRSAETFQREPAGRSVLVAVLLGLGLLVSRSTWSGLHPTIFDFTIPGVLLLITVCAFAPFCEELFFRGYLWSKLSKNGYGGIMIVIATSILYVLPHAPSSLTSFVDYATIGFALGFIRYFSGGLILPIVFHAAMNTILIFRL